MENSTITHFRIHLTRITLQLTKGYSKDNSKSYTICELWPRPTMGINTHSPLLYNYVPAYMVSTDLSSA
jgi:hypothetical protein